MICDVQIHPGNIHGGGLVEGVTGESRIECVRKAEGLFRTEAELTGNVALFGTVSNERDFWLKGAPEVTVNEAPAKKRVARG